MRDHPNAILRPFIATNQTVNANSLDDWKTISALAKRYPDVMTEDQLRWAIFRREQNGLAKSGALSKKGKRWYVCIPRFLNWLTDSEAAGS